SAGRPASRAWRSPGSTSASRSRRPTWALLGPSPRSLLMEMDQRAADLARAGEQLEQLVGLAPADGPLQVEQVFLVALQHFEHGLAIVHEHVAPHRRIGR